MLPTLISQAARASSVYWRESWMKPPRSKSASIHPRILQLTQLSSPRKILASPQKESIQRPCRPTSFRSNQRHLTTPIEYNAREETFIQRTRISFSPVFNGALIEQYGSLWRDGVWSWNCCGETMFAYSSLRLNMLLSLCKIHIDFECILRLILNSEGIKIPP